MFPLDRRMTRGPIAEEDVGLEIVESICEKCNVPCPPHCYPRAESSRVSGRQYSGGQGCGYCEMKASEILSITSHASVTSISNPSWARQLYQRLGALNKSTLWDGYYGVGCSMGNGCIKRKTFVFLS